MVGSIPMNGIVAYGAYLPYFRLDRKAIGETARQRGRRRAPGSVASYDEDTTSMGVEAGARRAARGAAACAPAAVYFATADPGLSRQDQRDRDPRRARAATSAATPTTCSARSARRAGALRAAIGRVAADAGRAGRHPHRPAGRRGRARRRRRARRRSCWLGRRATGPVLAEPVGARVGHRRVPRALAAAGRCGLAAVGGALRRARLRAARGGRDRRARCKQAGVTAGEPSRAVIVAGPHGRASKRARRRGRRAKPTALGDDLTGTRRATPARPTPGSLLADALDRAAGRRPHHGGLAGRRLRRDDLAGDRRASRAAAGAGAWRPQIDAGGRVSLRRRSSPGAASSTREPPRRPDPRAPGGAAVVPRRVRGSSASPAAGARRAARGTCRRSGCALKCRAVDRMTPGAAWPTCPATIATFTVDRLAYSLSPPVVAGGHRLRGRRPLPVRADRRRPRRGEDRRPGRDDVPPALHR